MMDDSEKFMINYQKCNALTFDQEYEESSDSDKENGGIPKMFSKAKIKHRVKVDNFMVG